MPVRLRLQRQGRKKQPFYFIVAADSRSPRDGKFLEKIGTYDPTKVPASIDLNNDKALNWLDKGAQPSDTVHKILSYKGVLYKKHLLRGVKKGAFSLEEAEKRYQEWLDSKEAAITTRKSTISKTLEQQKKEKSAAEQKKREEKAKSAAEALAAAEAETAAKVAASTAATENTDEASAENAGDAPSEETPVVE
jgi:small subunit ribosomal protein S16